MAVITLSRQFGAGGITLGRMVAKRLGFPFYDNEIIQMVAQKAQVSTRWVESMEKEAGGKLHRLLSGLVSKTFIERLLGDDRGYIDETIYVDLLHQIITRIADEKNAIILGRGSQFILKDRSNAHHVLLVADREYRIHFIEERYDLFTKHAEQAVSREEKRRINLYRKFGREDYDDPVHYDMVLNMSLLGLDQACDLICKLVTR